MALEIEEQKLLELTEALEFLQLHSKVCIDKVSGEEGRKMCKGLRSGEGGGPLACCFLLWLRCWVFSIWLGIFGFLCNAKKLKVHV